MTIFVPLGGDVKEAARQLRGWVLRRCPHCGADKTREHDRRVRVVPLGGRERVEVEVVQWRYVCRNCQRKTTPLPDCLVPASRYPSGVRDYAIEEYLSGRLTYQQLADVIGCSKSTCWRWLRAVTWRAGPLVQTCREQVAAAGEPVGPLVLPEGKRALWQRRRVRAPGMLEGLLLGEALLGWAGRFREAWRRRPIVLPEGLWSLCCHVLEHLTPPQPTEPHAGSAPAMIAPGGTGLGGGRPGTAAGGSEALRDDRAAGGGGGAAGGPDGPVAGTGGGARRDGAHAAAPLPALPPGGRVRGAAAAGAAGGLREPEGAAGGGAGRGGATASGAAGAEHGDTGPAAGGAVPGAEGTHRAGDAGPAPAPPGDDAAAPAGGRAGAAALPERAPQRPLDRGFQLPAPAVAGRQRTPPDGDPGDQSADPRRPLPPPRLRRHGGPEGCRTVAGVAGWSGRPLSSRRVAGPLCGPLPCSGGREHFRGRRRPAREPLSRPSLALLPRPAAPRWPSTTAALPTGDC